jgi:predicted 3-demethylubiquinone-9 3-methyltransferase (glyoxalase superfamily)
MQKITPYLWYDGKADEAARFYVSVFKDARVVASGPRSTTFELFGQRYIALNGGPMYKFTEAVSFFVSCTTQDEVDHYWNALIADGGAESMCGWLKDRYGLSWQVIPEALMRYLSDADRAKADRAAQAMLTMRKIDIAALDAAAAAG